MDPIKQRIAIAEFCGATPCEPIQGKRTYPTWKFPDGRKCTQDNLPNYPKDLNACWQATGKLDPHQLRVMNDLLKDRASPDGFTWRLHPADVAKALLLTIGKWEGGKP